MNPTIAASVTSCGAQSLEGLAPAREMLDDTELPRSGRLRRSQLNATTSD